MVLKFITSIILIPFATILYSGCYGGQPGSPPPPYNLEAELVGGAVYLTWNPVPCDRYHVERSVSTSGNWIEISTRPQNQNFYQDETAYPSETFYYRVRSYDSSYDPPYSDYSNEASIFVE